MAINLEAIRSKLNSMNTASQKNNFLWKPEAGSQIIRLVPYQYVTENPFIELYFHYNVGGKTILSPVSFGRPDPIAEFGASLMQTGDKEDWKMGKNLQPLMRTYVPLVVRGKESEGVKFWNFGKKVYQELLSFFADPDYGDLTDVVGGRDIVIEFTPAASAGSFPDTKIRVKPNQSKLTDNKQLLETLTSKQPNVNDMFKEPTYAELEKTLKDWLDPESDMNKAKDKKSAEADATTSNTAPTTNVASSANTASASNVDDAFDALFSK